MTQPQFPFDDQTWIISDTHFFYEYIGRYCERPDGWQETLGMPVTLASFNSQLIEAARNVQMACLPA